MAWKIQNNIELSTTIHPGTHIYPSPHPPQPIHQQALLVLYLQKYI